MVVALGGCSITFDIDEPIAVVPDSSWSEADVQALHRAVACWQQQFGVPFTFDEGAANQRIAVGYDKLTCIGNDGGQFMPPGQIDICPIDLLQPRAFPTVKGANADADILFIVLLHELGHAAGILGHASDQEAVMGHAVSLTFLASYGYLKTTDKSAFNDEDRAIFIDANGAYTGTCGGSDPVAGKSGSVDPIECKCPNGCSPDELEPNDVFPRPLAQKRAYDLNLCDSERDRFQMSLSARVRIESSTCGLTMAYHDTAAVTTTYGLVDVMAKAGDLLTLQHPQFGVCDYRLVIE